jgi:hypothetical protein
MEMRLAGTYIHFLLIIIECQSKEPLQNTHTHLNVNALALNSNEKNKNKQEKINDG